jgi:hypothetical protein
MTDTIKLTEEELSTLQSHQIRWDILTKKLGELHYKQKAIMAELTLTEQSLDEFDSERFEFVQGLQTKYGVGTINVGTGEFLPEAK